ncbi:MAG: metallophosphoesterase [Phycisphaerae bacterium]|nr:metallophosphoesterase [Phycisphaerae bacterium]
MDHGYVISDLHLFARRSIADDHLESMRAAADKADFFVLNGDIFDFRWTTLDTVETTVHAAMDWLESFARRHPNCRVFYVLGNHDSWEFFTRHLDELEAREPNFQWFPSHVRIGTSLFLHGDLPLGLKRRKPFHRRLPRKSRQRGRFLHAAYDALIFTGLHRLPGRWYWRRRCAKRFLRALRRERNGFSEGLTDIYFGHTHNVFCDYHFRGITFHNTGSTIQGLEGNLLRVRTRDENGNLIPHEEE